MVTAPHSSNPFSKIGSAAATKGMASPRTRQRTSTEARIAVAFATGGGPRWIDLRSLGRAADSGKNRGCLRGSEPLTLVRNSYGPMRLQPLFKPIASLVHRTSANPDEDAR